VHVPRSLDRAAVCVVEGNAVLATTHSPEDTSLACASVRE
jgi:hypothetical protein